jgi:xylulokinase
VGIDDDLFSKVISSGTSIGRISEEIAAELGLPKSLILAIGGHDQPCAALGAGVINDGMALISTGSTEGITLILPKILSKYNLEESNFPREPFVINGVYNTLAYNHTAGFLLNWFIETFTSKVPEEAKDTKVFKYFDSMCPEPPTRVFILPHFSGSGTPHMDVRSKGAIIGLNLATSKYEIYKAFLEGMTYELAYNLEFLNRLGVQINGMRAAGGGANSRIWLQIKADILNKEITTLECNEAAALGASILAAKACGDYKSLEHAIKSMVRLKDKFYPDKAKVGIYAEKLNTYKKIYSALKEINANI